MDLPWNGTTQWDDSDWVNARHLADPEVGDYWHEMFNPVLVVLARFPGHVVVCDTIKEADRDHWTWDLNQLKMLSLTELAARLRYNTSSHLCWARVLPCRLAPLRSPA